MGDGSKQASRLNAVNMPWRNAKQVLRPADSLAGVTDDAVLNNFLDQTPVMYPNDYLQRSCHTPRYWLPIFYYVNMAGLSVDQAVAILEKEEASLSEKLPKSD